MVIVMNTVLKDQTPISVPYSNINHFLLLQVESAGIPRRNVDKLEELVSLVETARTKSDSSKL